MRLCVVCAALALLSGCLPEDTRPEPGRLNVSVSGDGALDPASQGLTSADGWQIIYERFLVSLGEIRLEGDHCTTYNESDYLRIFDMRLGKPQRVSTAYAHGACEFTFRIQLPGEQAVLGSGVTPADRDFMRAPGSDAYVHNAGILMFVSGTAVSSERAKRFSWAFRRGVQYRDCRSDGQAGVDLKSSDDQSLTILIRSSTLFQDVPDDAEAELRFEPFARADELFGDGDGEITLEELGLVPIDASLGSERWATLADLLYLGLVPRVPRFSDNGMCSIGPIEEAGHGP